MLKTRPKILFSMQLQITNYISINYWNRFLEFNLNRNILCLKEIDQFFMKNLGGNLKTAHKVQWRAHEASQSGHAAQILTITLIRSSELYHISGVRTHVQKVKPKMAEFEEL